jgi:hypothetical protein
MIAAPSSFSPRRPPVLQALPFHPRGCIHRIAPCLPNNGLAVSAAAYVLDSLAAGYTAFAPSGISSAALPAGSPFREIGPIAAGATISFTVNSPASNSPASNPRAQKQTFN